MSVRAFLSAGFAALVEAWQHIGNDLLSAVDRANESIGLPVGAAPAEAANQQALAQLEEQLKGIGK